MIQGKSFNIFIDAGVEFFRIHIVPHCDSVWETPVRKLVIPNNNEIRSLLRENAVLDYITGEEAANNRIYITGKMAEATQEILGRGDVILSSAALWCSAKYLQEKSASSDEARVSTGIVDLSASGYMAICLNPDGTLMHDLCITNPRCGAGSGVNLSRILGKLDISHGSVDRILASYKGESGSKERRDIPVRTDRCGVFSSSATISDKNQGIPVDYALAVTIKSEIRKPISRIPEGLKRVYLYGGVFKWEFARDCARDFLGELNIRDIEYIPDRDCLIDGMKYLINEKGNEFRRITHPPMRKSVSLTGYPSFKKIKEEYESQGLYFRVPGGRNSGEPISRDICTIPVNMGLDIGSTMAKIVLSDASTGNLLYFNSYENHGDTIETVKHIFKSFRSAGLNHLLLQNIGITGSGRYQVQKALRAIYPHIEDRISVLVENYAHAKGSLDYAREHIKRLKNQGKGPVNENFCVLVDIGGEDTKISVISLAKEELFDNAMNIKCSAGTGSLMDTLKSLISIDEVAEAYRLAFEASTSYEINATCAVFLMENARRMQAQGYPHDQILASCAHAIVENMARTLWEQVEMPENAVVLLHGQTMLSDPLPLAVAHRLKDYHSSASYCLVPPMPGHRACVGLIRDIEKQGYDRIDDKCDLDHFIEMKFDKKIFFCRGAACGDSEARCARTMLKSSVGQRNITLTLGGCTAVNDMEARKDMGKRVDVRDSYRDIWKFIDERLSKSDDPKRLIIPRSFAISQKSYFFMRIFEQFGIPVHCDNVRKEDIPAGQPYFPIDTCAPNIGATGQLLRLVQEEYGIILIPQIDFLPTGDTSLGRTCTTNQGGVFIAKHFARMNRKEARIKVFPVSLDQMDPEASQYIADQLIKDLKDVFDFYEKKVSKEEFERAVKQALIDYKDLYCQLGDFTAQCIQEAVDGHHNISIILGREYILNPGIYDSHIGKLLRDKGVIAVPSYAVQTEMDIRYNYMYWKNPHDILTKMHAIADSCLHTMVKNESLSKVLKSIETGQTESRLSVVVLSTFRCGPDSVTLPALNEISRNIPSLLIQSDAAIAELAHLENRVNTHLNQLEKKLYEGLSVAAKMDFKVELLNEFCLDTLNPETDVIYFPTLQDNRLITSVFKAMGVTVIDNYNDETYDLEKKAKMGRRFVGDSVCVPLAAVFCDMLEAINDFTRKTQSSDPLVRNKHRLLLFMHGGDGPCRLGQYVDIFKLCFFRLFGKRIFQSETPGENAFQPAVKLLENLSSSLLGRDDYSAKLEKWIGYLAYQCVILKGVLHTIYIKAAANCAGHDEFIQMQDEFRKLKNEIFNIIASSRPGRLSKIFAKSVERFMPRFTGIAHYFAYGIYNSNGLRKPLKKFTSKWIRPYSKKKRSDREVFRIHIDGEIYMRVAMVEDILKHLIDSTGFRSFEISYSPIWVFFENILEARILVAKRDIDFFSDRMNIACDDNERKEFQNSIHDRERIIADTEKTISNFRNILAAPLYKAACLDMPHPMKKIFSAAKSVVPTFKPFGELVPYVGETILNLREGVQLILNVAPEGCMVSSMGQILSRKLIQEAETPAARIQNLFSVDGEIDHETLQLALLKSLGPERFYGI